MLLSLEWNRSNKREEKWAAWAFSRLWRHSRRVADAEGDARSNKRHSSFLPVVVVLMVVITIRRRYINIIIIIITIIINNNISISVDFCNRMLYLAGMEHRRLHRLRIFYHLGIKKAIDFRKVSGRTGKKQIWKKIEEMKILVRFFIESGEFMFKFWENCVGKLEKIWENKNSG